MKFKIRVSRNLSQVKTKTELSSNSSQVKTTTKVPIQAHRGRPGHASTQMEWGKFQRAVSASFTRPDLKCQFLPSVQPLCRSSTGACCALLFRGEASAPVQCPPGSTLEDPHRSSWPESPAGMLYRAGISCLRGCLDPPCITTWLPGEGTQKCSRTSRRQNS